ncbi:cyclic lactone autoinducer peptide [Sporosarcina aquimarina]|uniref:Cyclic lactone autoinducer peptide n=1 Tax=Sporosarcina aquimarina TaxID=114975 RepID=A0ABU4FW15_9BACL|nr:cyclic lactone autoinducer peptide [Sporosarcina aquimarina]MDW0108903.1 cyclic lactone autoinducer peptide [Sporosarcina aquimarina]
MVSLLEILFVKFGGVLMNIAGVGSRYMCWGFLDEEELPNELKSDEF